MKLSRTKPAVFRKRIALAVLLCLPLAGCGSRTDEAQEMQDMPKENYDNLISVGFSQIGSESIWRTANTESIQDALTTENGYFLIYSNARQKQENQIKAIRSFISQRVDYIVFSPVTETGWETVLEEAKEADIPVIMVDRRIKVDDDSLYTTWIGTDAEGEGRKAGEWLEQYLEKEGREDEEINIVVLQGTTGSSAQTGRSAGFDEVAGRHDNWYILAHKNGDFTTARGKEVMAEFLSMFKDIDVVVSQNDDMTFGALEAIEEAGLEGNGGMTIISFDAAREALQLVEQGIISVDVECNPLQGPYIDEVIKKMEAGEEIEKEYIVEEQVFTRENVSEYLPERKY